ncbi:transposase [Salinibacter ruber]|uniref:transposase n=1 Tax=Salinibacter ruber TaxID=146919 RepID=UPI00245058B9|nr:hypothetical protein [Salinibacter ruber]
MLTDLKRQLREEGRSLRARGPDSTVDDSVVLACEFIGEFPQKNTDSALFTYFRRHHKDLFPSLQKIHRTTFVRQSANLWAVKAMIHRRLLRRLWRSPRAWVDPRLSAVDSFPMPVCRFIRASQCKVFRAEAAYGFDETTKQTMYGFRGHVEVAWPGVITSVSVAPANEHDATVAPEVLEGGPERGCRAVLGDKNYCNPRWRPVSTTRSDWKHLPRNRTTQDGLPVGRASPTSRDSDQPALPSLRCQAGVHPKPMASNEPMNAENLQSHDLRHALPAGRPLAPQLW